jgi:hypothetical protein
VSEAGANASSAWVRRWGEEVVAELTVATFCWATLLADPLRRYSMTVTPSAPAEIAHQRLPLLLQRQGRACEHTQRAKSECSECSCQGVECGSWCHEQGAQERRAGTWLRVLLQHACEKIDSSSVRT